MNAKKSVFWDVKVGDTFGRIGRQSKGEDVIEHAFEVKSVSKTQFRDDRGEAYYRKNGARVGWSFVHVRPITRAVYTAWVAKMEEVAAQEQRRRQDRAAFESTESYKLASVILAQSTEQLVKVGEELLRAVVLKLDEIKEIGS